MDFNQGQVGNRRCVCRRGGGGGDFKYSQEETLHLTSQICEKTGTPDPLN